MLKMTDSTETTGEQSLERIREYRKLPHVKAKEREGRLRREAAKKQARLDRGEKLGRWPDGKLPPKNLEYKKKWARDTYARNIKTHLVRNARQRAKTFGVPFEITKEDIVIPDFCPVLGIPIRVTTFSNGRKDWGNSPSLDRIVPELGYVKGNICVISLRANRIKCDATPEELRRVYEYCRDRWGPR